MESINLLIIRLTLAFLLGVILAGGLSYYTFYIYSVPFWVVVAVVWAIAAFIIRVTGRC